MTVCSASFAEQRSCSTVNLTSELPPMQKWIKTNEKPPRAVTLVIHGLNLRPEKMDSIAQELNQMGQDVFRASLSGHRNNKIETSNVDRKKWGEDLFIAYCRARQEADKNHVPLYFVGYSLGGLINLDMMNDPQNNISYDRMVLLAPAISVHTTSYLVKILSVLGKNFEVPSAANEAYRSNCNGTTNAAYNGLFESIAELEKNGIKQNDTPTLVLIDPRDELVSEKGLMAMMKNHKLEKWSLFEVSNDETTLKSGAYHHLIIDEKSLGEKEWRIMVEAMKAHFSDKPLPRSLTFVSDAKKLKNKKRKLDSNLGPKH